VDIDLNPQVTFHSDSNDDILSNLLIDWNKTRTNSKERLKQFVAIDTNQNNNLSQDEL